MSEAPNTPDGRAPTMLPRPPGTRKAALLQGIQALRRILAQGSEDRVLLEAKLAAQKEKKEGATDEVAPTLRAIICTPAHIHTHMHTHCFPPHTFIHSKYPQYQLHFTLYSHICTQKQTYSLSRTRHTHTHTHNSSASTDTHTYEKIYTHTNTSTHTHTHAHINTQPPIQTQTFAQVQTAHQTQK